MAWGPVLVRKGPASALARLPVSQRVVLVLRSREGLSEQEIASTLGIPAGTVKSRLHRARAAFREGWES
ncbi:MAG: sigma-70 family RNA polymerase sigma factor [Streptosporangiaceae bacterium]